LRVSNVELPFSRGSTKESARFTVTATIRHHSLSSDMIRVSFDECLEAMQVNGIDVDAVRDIDNSVRCDWWVPIAIDLTDYLADGPNTITIDVADKSGLYGIDITGIYALPALYGLAASLGVFLYVLLFGFLANGSPPAWCYRYLCGRLHQMSFLPIIGVIYLCAVRANMRGAPWNDGYYVTGLVAWTVSLTLLIRLMDRQSHGVMPLKLSACAATVSIGCLAYASMLMPMNVTDDVGSFLWTIAGIVAGFLAFLNPLTLARLLPGVIRPVCIALLAAITPQAFSALNLTLWSEIASVTATAVRGILWACGIATTTYTGESTLPDGQRSDYYAYVVSPEFSIQIGAWCSGFEGVALFLFLLCGFVLIDWKMFSKVRHLWVAFVLTVPFVLVVNSFRIAGLFLYAEWNVLRYGRTQAVTATIEAFHSNIGWVIYTVAFAIYLPMVYRWARCSAKIS
jgi:exosortase/archaeosortase family protein